MVIEAEEECDNSHIYRSNVAMLASTKSLAPRLEDLHLEKESSRCNGALGSLLSSPDWRGKVERGETLVC